MTINRSRGPGVASCSCLSATSSCLMSANLFSKKEVGDLIRVDEILGTIIDPITNETSNILATISGRIISMAVNQFVMPGYGCYHIGIEASEEKIAELGITDNIEGEVE